MLAEGLSDPLLTVHPQSNAQVTPGLSFISGNLYFPSDETSHFSLPFWNKKSIVSSEHFEYDLLPFIKGSLYTLNSRGPLLSPCQEAKCAHIMVARLTPIMLR